MPAKEIKEYYRKTFNTVADGYDSPALRFFPESAARLPGFLGLKGDEHVLDVATGTGATALALARALPAGRVTGIDFSRRMLARARAKLAGQGLDNVNLGEMDMQCITLPDGRFDAATCTFALFFVEDMREQLRHIAAKVKKGGKVAVTSFFETSFSPLVDVFFTSLERYGVTPPSMTWKRVATPEKCTALFAGAGLCEISVDHVECPYFLAGPEEWWQIVWNGGFRGLVEQMDEDARWKFREEHLAELAELSVDEGIRMEFGVLYAVGTV